MHKPGYTLIGIMKSTHCLDIQAIIFDLDGTIVNSEPLHELTFFQLFDKLGHKDDHGINFEEYLGTSDEAVWIDFLKKFPQNRSLNELLEWKQEAYLELAWKDNPVFPGVVDMIQDLSGIYNLSIASGSRHEVIDAMLKMSSIDHLFTVKVSSQDVEKGKPDPEIFILTAEKLGLSPDSCLVIEDSIHGVTGANEAGMKTIAITNSFKAEDLSHAWKVVTTYSEIRNLLIKSL